MELMSRLYTALVRVKLIIAPCSSFTLVMIMTENKEDQNKQSNQYGAERIVSGRNTAGCLHRDS